MASILAPKTLFRGRFPFLFPSLFPSEKRPVEPAGSASSLSESGNLSRILSGGLWPPFRVHPEVLSLSLHKPPKPFLVAFSLSLQRPLTSFQALPLYSPFKPSQPLSGAFSAHSWARRSWIIPYLFPFSFKISNGFYPEVRGDRGSLSDSIFLQQEKCLLKDFSLGFSFITPAKSAVWEILSLRSGDLRKTPQTELRLPHSNGCSTMTYPVGQVRSQPSYGRILPQGQRILEVNRSDFVYNYC